MDCFVSWNDDPLVIFLQKGESLTHYLTHQVAHCRDTEEACHVKAGSNKARKAWAVENGHGVELVSLNNVWSNSFGKLQYGHNSSAARVIPRNDFRGFADDWIQVMVLRDVLGAHDALENIHERFILHDARQVQLVRDFLEGAAVHKRVPLVGIQNIKHRVCHSISFCLVHRHVLCRFDGVNRVLALSRCLVAILVRRFLLLC
mmetsp:Transcript_9547/g.17915  ORF Transcript_9547/g.17915 Transcript_9547/m.17915 type:complete len:203 (+) Transcript_9547:2216-2824(+)